MPGKSKDRDSGSLGGEKVAPGKTVHGAGHMAAKSAGFATGLSCWLQIANRGFNAGVLDCARAEYWATHTSTAERRIEFSK